MTVLKNLKPTRLGVFLGLTLLGVCYTLFFFPFPLVHAAPDYHILLLFFIVSVLIYSYPIKLGQNYLSLTLLTQLFIFVQFGLLVELLISQVGLLIFILFSKRKLQVKHILFHGYLFWVSIFSASAYHLTLPWTTGLGSINLPLIAILAYVIVGFLADHLILNWTLWIRGKKLIPFEFHAVKWTMLTILLAVPVSILLLVVYQSSLGLVGTIIVIIPALIIVYIFKLLNDVEHTNKQMKIIHELTFTFTSELDVEKNLNALISAIEKVQPYDMCFLLRFDQNDETLVPVRFHSRFPVNHDQMYNFSIRLNEGVSGQVAATGKSILIQHEPALYFAPSLPAEMKEMSSVLSVPLQTKDKILGVLLMGTSKEYGYSKKDLTLIEILANHAATSIENAYIFQQTERRALHDELTGLCNYRGFELQLEQHLDKAKHTGQKLALLLIDIDHFKKVNDQFGHVSGNQVLMHLAKVIKKNVRKNDIISRYGGEEFTILLPDTDQKEALEIAERIREAIPAHPISLDNDLSQTKGIYIQNTVSIGIAVYPHHADDAFSLVRHADRAMYVGAKHAGRNRVSVYDAS